MAKAMGWGRNQRQGDERTPAEQEAAWMARPNWQGRSLAYRGMPALSPCPCLENHPRGAQVRQGFARPHQKDNGCVYLLHASAGPAPTTWQPP